MMADIVNLSQTTNMDIPPERVLQGAIKAGMTEAVVVGFDADGNDYFASSKSDAAAILWSLERAKWRLMRQCDDLEAGE